MRKMVAVAFTFGVLLALPAGAAADTCQGQIISINGKLLGAPLNVCV